MTTFTQAFTQKRKRELRLITHVDARKFLLKHGYTTTQNILPEYYRPSGFDKINLSPINWTTKNPSVCITKPLVLITPKGRLGWRNFSFIHPYIFLHKVDTLTERKSWSKIKSLLCKRTLVHSYSVPVMKIKRGQKLTGVGINSWIQMAERDLIKDAGPFHFLTVTDIQNFYPSIYTHSISWAIDTKPVAKAQSNRNNYTFLGNRVDKLFMNSRDGQTNGIPIGSLVSDIIAEIILTDVDDKLSKKLREKRLQKKVIITRYRDDYRVLSRNEEEGHIVIKMLNEILHREYDLHLNSDKTHQYSDIIEGSFRPWLLEVRSSPILRKVYRDDVSECCTTPDLKDCLLAIYSLQRKYPDRNVALTLVSKLANAYSNNSKILKVKSEEIPELVALLRKLTLLKEEVTPAVYVILNILFKKVHLLADRQALLKTTSFIMTGGSDNAYQLIWYHRLCWAIAPDLCKDIHKSKTQPLIAVLRGKKADFKIFENCNISNTDNKAMEDFCMIDKAAFKKLKGKNINPKAMNPFSY